jgi:hypothetical protein
MIMDMQTGDKTSLGGVGLGLAVAVAAAAGPLAFPNVLPAIWRSIFWCAIALAGLCFFYLLCLHFDWRKRLAPLLLMIVGGIMFFVGASWYGISFLPVDKLDRPNSTNKPSGEQPSIVETPDVTLEFVFAESPGLVLVNRSNKIAREIRWAVVLWNIDDPKVYSNPTAPDMQSNHEPLPIPTSTVDFVRPHSETGPLNLFGSPIIRSNVKAGDRLIGSASVICPDCARGYTFIVYIVFGQGGWYYNDLNNRSGDVVIPRRLTRQNVLSYFNELIQRVAEKDRIPITDPF